LQRTQTGKPSTTSTEGEATVEFRQLWYFTVIARRGGFRRAAEVLDVSQTTLSLQIKQLERELQVQLFERGPRRIALTEAGRVLLERAERITVEVKLAREEMLEFADLQRGHVKVGMTSPHGMGWVPRLLAEFRQRHPRVDITLVERPSEHLLKLLRDAEIHVAWLLVPAEDAEALRGICVERLYTGEFILVVPREHPLANAERVTLDQIGTEPLILPPPGELGRAMVDQAFRARGLEPHVGFESADPGLRITLAAAGLGAALTSQPYLRRSNASVAGLTLADIDTLHSLALAWTERGTRTRAVADFVEHARGGTRDWVRHQSDQAAITHTQSG
jgi:DNA-binding transcriptional LysR family regulator